VRTRSSGFSLIELMIAIAVGIVVSGAVLAFAMASMKSNGDFVLSTRLTQELRNSLDLATRDLRRAGYDEDALAKIGTNSASKFARMKLDSEITPSTTPKTYSCVIYGYDRPDQGSCGGTPPQGGVVDTCNGEVRGLRRVSVSFQGRTQGVIEYAVSAGTTTPACDGASPAYTSYPVACNTTSKWCLLSDPTRLDITSMTLTDRRTTVGDVQMRDIGVGLRGRIAGSSEIDRAVSTNVRIRSECYDTVVANCSNAPSN
jgi:prepilin-type N-terminal cleavage/methylation domain-containing protein